MLRSSPVAEGSHASARMMLLGMGSLRYVPMCASISHSARKGRSSKKKGPQGPCNGRRLDPGLRHTRMATSLNLVGPSARPTPLLNAPKPSI